TCALPISAPARPAPGGPAQGVPGAPRARTPPARRGWRRWRPRGARGRRMASPITSFGDLCRVLGPFRGFVLARALDHQRLGVEGLTVEPARSEEHTSELQSRENLVCRPLLETKHITR